MKKNLSEIVELINEYLESQRIPEEWLFTLTGELCRRNTNDGSVVKMTENDARQCYAWYVADPNDETDEDRNFIPPIEYADPMKKRADLHEEMIESIVYLMERNNKETVSFTKGEDCSFAIISINDDCPMQYEEVFVNEVQVVNSKLKLNLDGYGWTLPKSDMPEILPCSIVSVYDALWSKLMK